ncbi:hypothetical protein NBC122_00678 [Chryseobacterium salivictor]|uniref:Glycosyltransferase RgtA/B/C/D-like domain-containing protein n=2 Tax=Chryseobacterium salivictor TaxID=2547600 RepID=A0A4V1AKU8_9FLAO|nr:hypothetical protein NBC122_00678 [Chryseobacterium salivictor]
MKFPMKNKIYYILFLLYVTVLLISLQKEVQLENEWKAIMNDFLMDKGYRLLGVPTAYMPPFYSYYLLICKKVFGFTSWIKVSCFIQAIIYYFSLHYLFKTFLKDGLHQWRIIILFLSVLFFPPILVGSLSISSFSLSVSILCVFFALLYKIYDEKDVKIENMIYIAVISIAGLYIRYEFIFILILSGLIYLFLRKISVLNFIKILVFVFLAYLPWTIRNYIYIGKFTYSTSLNYNFAKGYNEVYDIFSSYNFPYAPETKRKESIGLLYKELKGEKEVDEHLSALNKDFIDQHPGLFLKLTVQKLAINFLQFFPDYKGLSKYRIYIFYSIFFVIFQAVLILAMKRLKDAKNNYLLMFTLSFYLFSLFFYTIAPMPRYFLLFYPIFTVIIVKSFQDENGSYFKIRQKKTAS